VSGPVAASIITASATILTIIITAVVAVWRIGANRRYRRRIDHVADLQDHSLAPRATNRNYGTAVQDIVDAANEAADEAAKSINPPDPRFHNLGIERKVPPDVDQAQAAALDGVSVAETRVEDEVIVQLSKNWRRMSRLHSLDLTDVNASQEEEAWEWFHQACAQALNSSRGRLKRSQRKAWQAKLADVVDDSNSTEPDPPDEGHDDHDDEPDRETGDDRPPVE
jgi:hypothetical protein